MQLGNSTLKHQAHRCCHTSKTTFDTFDILSAVSNLKNTHTQSPSKLKNVTQLFSYSPCDMKHAHLMKINHPVSSLKYVGVEYVCQREGEIWRRLLYSKLICLQMSKYQKIVKYDHYHKVTPSNVLFFSPTNSQKPVYNDIKHRKTAIREYLAYILIK